MITIKNYNVADNRYDNIDDNIKYLDAFYMKNISIKEITLNYHH